MKLQQLCERAYLEVLGFKAYQVSAGAFFRIAYMYDTFANTLTDLDPPRAITENPDHLDTYQMLIEQVVLPLEEQAIKSARKALELTHKKHVYNEWSKRSAILASKLSPESFPVLNDAVVNTEWSVSPLTINNPDTVIRDSLLRLSKEPRNLKALQLLSSAYILKRDYKNGLRYIKTLLQIRPKDIVGIMNLGIIYSEDKHTQLAELMFRKVLGFDSKSATAHANLGLTYYRLNRIPLAVHHFQKAIALNGMLVEARLNLGSIYLDYLKSKLVFYFILFEIYY